MNCLTELALTELALTVVGNTAEDARIRKLEAHINGCESCKRAFAQHLTIMRGLDSAARIPDQDSACLDENAIAEFADRVMNDREYNTALHHFAQCQECAVKLSDLAACLEASKPSLLSYAFKKAKDGLEVLLHPEEGFSLVSHQPAMVLDAATAEPAIFSWRQEVDDCTVQFDLQELEFNSYSLQLMVYPADAIPPKTQLVVRVAGDIIQAQPLPESGRVRLDNLHADTYELELESSNSKLGPFGITFE